LFIALSSLSLSKLEGIEEEEEEDQRRRSLMKGASAAPAYINQGHEMLDQNLYTHWFISIHRFVTVRERRGSKAQQAHAAVF